MFEVKTLIAPPSNVVVSRVIQFSLSFCLTHETEILRRQTPTNAVEGGHDQSGETYYVGRAKHDDYWVPGKLQPSHCGFYYSFGGNEYHRKEYEVLVLPSDGRTRLKWVQSSGNRIPFNAVPCGVQQQICEQYYIGRHDHDGALVIGKVHPFIGLVKIIFHWDS